MEVSEGDGKIKEVWALSKKDWDKMEQEYLEMKEQDFEQVNMPELWSRIEEKLDQSQSTEKKVKMRKSRPMKRKVAAYGTLAAAAFLAIASWSVMRAGNSLQNESTPSTDFSGSVDNEGSPSFQENGSQESANKESIAEKEESAEINDQNTEDSASKGSAKQYDAVSQNEVESVDESISDSSASAESEEKKEANLLSVEKENGRYEFSVNLENYDLQLVEISENKKEDVVSIVYYDFSVSAREVLQEKISDISSYAFYIDPEGVLYMERDDRYYQMHLGNRVH